MMNWQRCLKIMLSVGLVVLGSVVLSQCFKPSPNIQSWKVVRMSNVVEVYYPASGKALVDQKEWWLCRFDWRSQHLPLSIYVQNLEKPENQSFDEVLQIIKKGREAEGRQFVGLHTLETNQRVVVTVLVFDHKARREIREWIVVENPYLRNHIVAVYWSSFKDDYDRARQEIYKIVKQIRLLSGPPVWLEDKPRLRRDENVG